MSEKEPIRWVNIIMRKLQQGAEAYSRLHSVSVDDAKKELAKKWGKALVDDGQTAQEYTKNARSKERDKVMSAEEQLERERYSTKTPAATKEFQRESYMLAQIRGDLPDWLATGVPELNYCPQAMETLARITLLPQEQREDPYVLYRLLRRMEASIDYQASTKEALFEAKIVREVVTKKIVESAGANPDFVDVKNDGMFGDRFDLYRSKKLGPAPAGSSHPEPSRERRQEHAQWARENAPREQHEKLERELESLQQNIDDGAYVNNDEEIKQLGSTRAFIDRGTRPGKNGVVSFNEAEAREYINKIDNRRRILQSQVDIERQARERAQRGEGGLTARKKELEEAGALIVWKDTMTEKYRNPERKVNDMLNIRQGLFTAKELKEMIEGGEEGIENWIYRFLEKNTSLAGQGFRENIDISSTWAEFKKVTEWLWGERNESRVLQYEEFFKLYEDLDGVLKAVLSRSKGDKPEESFKLMRFISDLHYETLRRTDLIQYAKPAFTESILSVMSDESADYHEALNWLKERVPYNGRQMTRAKVWEALFEKSEGSKGVPGVARTSAENALMKDIEARLDRVGMGVLLRDVDMMPNIEAHNNLKMYFDTYQENILKLSAANPPISHDERTRLTNQQAELKSSMQREWKENVTRDKVSEFNPDASDAQFFLESVYRMSPVKIRARTRIIQALRLEGKSSEQIREMEPKIRISLWAAEAISIGKGEAMEKGARLGLAPGFDIRYTLDIKDAHYRGLNRGWKYHMDRGFAEAYQRVLNDDLFNDDFNMGGAAAKVLRDLYYTHAFRIFGHGETLEKEIKNNREWNERMHEADRNQTPRWVVYIQYAREVMGIPYTELLRPNTLITGLSSIGTTWRDEQIVIRGIQEKLAWLRQQGRVGENATSEYQALGIRLASATTDVEKKQIFEIILQRKTSAIFSLVTGNEMDSRLLRGTGITRGSLEWRQFEDALALVEMNLAQKDEFRWTQYNLMDLGQFRSQMDSALKAVSTNLNDAERGQRITAYHQIMLNVNTFAHEQTVSGRDRMDEWVRHNWRNVYMVESTSFNWKETDHAIIDMYHVDRRMNDFNGQTKAGSIKRELLTNSDFYSPHEGKEPDMIVKLKELRGIIEGYSGTQDGEYAQTPILRAIIDYNRDLASRGIVGWIPFGSTVFRNLAWKISPGFRDFCIKWKLTDKPLNYWPRSFRGLVSTAGALSGSEANHWDEFFISKLLESVERNHNYTDVPELLDDIKQDYHATLRNRLLVGIPRKYTFAVLAATMAFAASQHVEEEKHTK